MAFTYADSCKEGWLVRSWDHPAVAVPSISVKLNSRTKYGGCGGTTRIFATLDRSLTRASFLGRKIRGGRLFIRGEFAAVPADMQV